MDLDITLASSEKVNILVYNSLGMIVSNSRLSLNNVSNSIYLSEFELLPSGVYTVQLESDLMDHTTRVIRIE